MTELKYEQVIVHLHKINEMTTMREVIDYNIKVSISDIDSKSRNFINRGLDAQMCILKAKQVIGNEVEHSAMSAERDSL